MKLGVIITHHSYARLPYVIDLLHSLNCQTVKDFTVYLVDDSQNKTDFTPFYECIAKGTLPRVAVKPLPPGYKGKVAWLNADPAKYGGRPLEPIYFNIRIIQLDVNAGASAACNAGIDHALSEGCDTIRIVDGDDIILFPSIEMQLKVLQNPNINCVSSDKLEFGVCHMGYQTKFSPDHKKFQAQALFWGSAVYKTAVMFKASILDKYPNGQLFDDSYKGVGDDIVMNARLGQVGGLACIPAPLVYYRRHTDNLSITQMRVFKEDYARSIRQIFRENCGIEVPLEFSYQYYETFHKFQNTPYKDAFVEEAVSYYRQSKYGDIDEIVATAYGALQVLSQQPPLK